MLRCVFLHAWTHRAMRTISVMHICKAPNFGIGNFKILWQVRRRTSSKAFLCHSQTGPATWRPTKLLWVLLQPFVHEPKCTYPLFIAPLSHESVFAKSDRPSLQTLQNEKLLIFENLKKHIVKLTILMIFGLVDVFLMHPFWKHLWVLRWLFGPCFFGAACHG